MSALQAIVGSTVYELNDGSLIGWEAEDGFGIPDTERHIQEGTLDGGVDFGYRLRPRRLALRVVALGVTETGLQTLRSQLIQIFKPRSTPVILRRTYESGAIRQLDVHYSGGMKMSTADRFANSQTAGIELVAPDPLWYDPDQKFVTFSIAGGGSGFVVPVVIPSTMGASTIDQTYTVTYAGSYREYPMLEIVGPITDLIIINNATGYVLDFTGYTIAAGVTYYIDLRPRYKTVLDQDGTNQIAKLTDTSDLAAFCLEADPDVAGGINAIRCIGSGVTAASIIYLRYYDRYIGV